MHGVAVIVEEDRSKKSAGQGPTRLATAQAEVVALRLAVAGHELPCPVQDRRRNSVYAQGRQARPRRHGLGQQERRDTVGVLYRRLTASAWPSLRCPDIARGPPGICNALPRDQ